MTKEEEMKQKIKILNSLKYEEKYKVSICIPVYNTKKELFEYCLDSILKCGLKEKDYEIVVIDDGSTEINAEEMVEAFKKNNPKINIDCWAHGKNEGLFEARRSAVSVAKGHYIFNLDSDDYLEENVLGELVNDFYDKDYDVIQTEYNDIGVTNDVKHEPIAMFYEQTNENNTLLRCLYNDAQIPGYIWGKLIKRSVYLKSFDELPYLYLIFNEDFLQTFFICKNAKSIMSVPGYVTYNYRRTTGMTSIGSLNMIESKFDQYLSYAEVMKIIDTKYTTNEKLKEFIDKRHISIMLQIYSSIIVGVKDEDLKLYIKKFKKAFGADNVKYIHELFNKMKK